MAAFVGVRKAANVMSMTTIVQLVRPVTSDKVDSG